MHILIISDAYPPMRTSCATQIYDLAQAFLHQGHQVSIIIPGNSQSSRVEILNKDGSTIYSVRCFRTKDVGYIRRTLAEFINPFIMGWRLKKNSRFVSQKIDGIAWYSPTIFWGPLIKQLKAFFKCRTYLILRDIFPDWALDLGLLNKNIIYSVFKRVERYQYEQADCIGVQSPNSVDYFKFHNPGVKARVELLWNWVGATPERKSPINIGQTFLAGRKIFIYAGNMGIAQDMDALLRMAELSHHDTSIGFVFIGRGSEKKRLQLLSQELGLTNIVFFDEIDNDQLDNLLRQCHVGLISLNQKHTTYNIPGKFLTYLKAELPVVAILNPGNDLIELVEANQLGVAITDLEDESIIVAIQRVLFLAQENQVKTRLNRILNQNFLSHSASKIIHDELI